MKEISSLKMSLSKSWVQRLAFVLVVPLVVGSPALSAPKINVDDRPLGRETRGTSFAPVVKKVSPSVVNIYSTKTFRVRMFPHRLFEDPLFRRFFGGDEESQPRRPQLQKTQSLGSGVIITEDGYILTNNHVVDGADEVKVALALADDKTEYTAKVVGTDPQTDIAVLKIEAKKLRAITIGDSDQVEVGDVVLAVGDPFGFGQSVSMGIVSALGRGLGMLGREGYEDFIQTDAPINPGNSGGALVDVEGRLVGINQSIISGSGVSQGVGFAIPVNLARSVMDHLIKFGKVTRGYLGVNIQPVTPDLAKEFKLADQSGALVGDVRPNTPAEEAGLKEGDVLIEFNGKKVADFRHLRIMVAQTPPKTKATLRVIREGKEKTLTATLGELPEDLAARSGGPAGEPEELSQNALEGVQVADLDSQARRRYDISSTLNGALVTDVDSGSEAYDAGLRPGDIILEINRKPVSNAQDATQFSREAKGDRILLRVWSKGGSRFVVVDNPARNR